MFLFAFVLGHHVIDVVDEEMGLEEVELAFAVDKFFFSFGHGVQVVDRVEPETVEVVDKGVVAENSHHDNRHKEVLFHQLDIIRRDDSEVKYNS